MQNEALSQGIHHAAYRCIDAKETVEFYRDLLGMTFTVAFAENEVPSTGEPDPYMHVFLDAGAGNVIAFFELPNSPQMGRDQNTPEWVQHIAFKLDSLADQTLMLARLKAAGVEVLGPVNHGIFDSIYFFYPNGHRLELTCRTASDEQMNILKQTAQQICAEVFDSC